MQATLSLAAAPESAADAAAPGSIDEAYRTLKLSTGARRRDVRQAYLRLALAHHPDRRSARSGSASDGDAFNRIRAAYEWLMSLPQFDEGLEALDEELDAAQRELEELEMCTTAD